MAIRALAKWTRKYAGWTTQVELHSSALLSGRRGGVGDKRKFLTTMDSDVIRSSKQALDLNEKLPGPSRRGGVNLANPSQVCCEPITV
jgi:hypothetical protein